MNEKPDLHPEMQCQKGGEPRFESLTPRGTFLDETLYVYTHVRTYTCVHILYVCMHTLCLISLAAKNK